MATAKPFVKWAGGKSHLLGQLQALLPSDIGNKEDLTYIEPFVGGGAMLFYMLSNYKNIKRVIINDINQDLITCYRLIKDNPLPLIKELKSLENRYTALSQEEQKAMYYQIREKYNSRKYSPTLEAAYFMFLNHTCFNGLYRVNSKSEFNVPCGKYKHPSICNEAVINADHQLLNSVDIIILNDDYKCIQKHILDDKYTFVYLDPPYMPISVTSYFKQYSSLPFEEKEQEELEQFCQQLSDMGCSIMISNSDCKTNKGSSYFEDLYSSFHIDRIVARRYINAHTTKRDQLPEIVIRNFSKLD